MRPSVHRLDGGHARRKDRLDGVHREIHEVGRVVRHEHRLEGQVLWRVGEDEGDGGGDDDVGGDHRCRRGRAACAVRHVGLWPCRHSCARRCERSGRVALLAGLSSVALKAESCVEVGRVVGRDSSLLPCQTDIHR